MTTTTTKKWLAFLPALVLLAFLVAGRVIAQSAPESQHSASTQAVALEPVVNETAPTVDIPIADVNEVPADPTPPAEKPKYLPPVQRVRPERDEYGTPYPPVPNAVQPTSHFIRDDGYDNYCYLLENGNWTTVTGKLELGKGIYLYDGEIDLDTQAPAYALDSQEWCAANVPPEAQ